MALRKISKEELLLRYQDKGEQLQREIDALEVNRSYLLIGETKTEDGVTTINSEVGQRIKDGALLHHGIKLELYKEVIKDLKRIK